MAGGEGAAPPAHPSRSFFDLPPDFFDGCRILSDPREIPLPPPDTSPPETPLPPVEREPPAVHGDEELKVLGEACGNVAASLWTCRTCGIEFESLQEQRLHFKSDLHRLNVKLHVSGRHAIKEEDFDDLIDETSFREFDVSSISGSEDESDSSPLNFGIPGQEREVAKQKIFIHLQSGETISIWKCLLLDEAEDLSFAKINIKEMGEGECKLHITNSDMLNRLRYLTQEPRDKTHLRIVLLLCGGHFAGCIFDGNSVIAHKTFHRYVVRAKAGKKQSAKDATGKAAHSAGSSLRRYNEAALRKEIHELLVLWRPYFDAMSCLFIYAPSKNYRLFFDGDKPLLSCQGNVVRHIPTSVRRPTLKEAKRVYNLLTHVSYEANLEKCSLIIGKSSLAVEGKEGNSKRRIKECLTRNLEDTEKVLHPDDSSLHMLVTDPLVVTSFVNEATPLHEAAKSGDAQQVLELLEQGLNPCVKDTRGRTAYMLASEKEVRNTFRRFMALNLDKWDWHAASVPSPLTNEMEESQAAKQAEKDAKRKAKAKELKKLRKAKEKAKETMHQQSVEAAQSKEHPATTVTRLVPSVGAPISPEEELKRALAAEREKRAAAAERRIAALRSAAAAGPAAASASSSSSGSVAPVGSSSPPSSSAAAGSGSLCSCCRASLAGKVPFHRYHYNYCSTSCMHVHRGMLEDG